MSRNIAVAYSMKKNSKKKGLADGGPVVEPTPEQAGSKPSTQLDFKEDEVPVNSARMSIEDEKDEAPKKMAEGGMVSCPHCKKSFSHGGEVANDLEEGAAADEKPNEFDDLVLDDSLEEHYTAKNSGDLVSRAMAKKKAKR